MYSVVLMMALSSGAEAPAWHGGNGCNGGGCWGGSSSCNGGGHFSKGCHGGGLFSHGCSGGHAVSHGCNGCSGGGMFSHGCHGGGGLFHKGSHGCNGGGSSCSGSSCHGGGLFSHGCHGGGGLFHKGSHGCNGSCNGGGCWASSASYGCVGSMSAPVMGAPMHGEMIAPPIQSKPPVTMPAAPEGAKKPPVKPMTAAPQAAPATIVVKLPADAKLLINDMAIDASQDTRIFRSRDIAMGQTLEYTVKASIVREGQTLNASKVVTAVPGQTFDVELQFPTATVAAK